MAEGSHRLHKSWYQDRHSWLDAAGAPKDAEWNRGGPAVQGPEGMADVTALGERAVR